MPFQEVWMQKRRGRLPQAQDQEGQGELDA